MEKLQILIGDALEAEDVLVISFFVERLDKMYVRIFFVAPVCLFVCRIWQLLRFS